MKIPEIPLVLNNTNEIELGFKYAAPEIGNRWQVGGSPTWIQEEKKVCCDECGKEMTFYAQLDSINDKIVLGDCGLIYVFFCFDCMTTKSIFQGY